MKIKLTLLVGVWHDDPDSETEFEEFKLNWGSQVPHWHFLSKEGVKFFKDE